MKKIIHTKKLDNLDEMNKFLEIPNLVRLNLKLIENFNRPVTSKDTKSVIKIFQQAALFTIVKTWVQPKLYLLKDKCFKIMWNIHMMEENSAIKRMKYCHLYQHVWT